MEAGVSEAKVGGLSPGWVFSWVGGDLVGEYHTSPLRFPTSPGLYPSVTSTNPQTMGLRARYDPPVPLGQPRFPEGGEGRWEKLEKRKKGERACVGE